MPGARNPGPTPFAQNFNGVVQFVHVVDVNDVARDKRANELTPELMEAVRGFEIYEHGCCGGQRAAMWKHLYDLDNDDAHDYELKYCAERAYLCSEDKKKLKVARVYATTKRTPIIDDVRGEHESLTAWMARLEGQLRDRTDAVGVVHNMLKQSGKGLLDAANGRKASRGWMDAIANNNGGTARDTKPPHNDATGIPKVPFFRQRND